MKESEPKLAPPGAGIPWPARVVLRLFVNPFVAGKEDLGKSRYRIEKKHDLVLAEYLAIPEALRGRKVLVPSQPGLEDSSRFWSAAMVLEHLEIVGRSISEGIIRLANDQDPETKADTAKVKPPGTRSAPEIFTGFDRWRIGALAYIDSRVVDLDSKRTMVHPWFGPLTARKWFWLLGIHADIHLRQIRAIRKILDLSAGG